jgi:hypothetical protein
MMLQASETVQSVTGGKVNILGRHSIGHYKQRSVYVHLSCSERYPRWNYFSVHSTDEQRAMSSHELLSASMLTVEFLKMCYTR